MKLFVFSILGFSLLTFAAGCHKKVPVAATPAPPKAQEFVAPKPNAPTISQFVVEPSRIERGQSALLRWQVKDAADININQGVGAVPASGERRVSPADATTYTLTAKGPGGSASAIATVDVVLPPPPPPVAPKPAPLSFLERLNREVQDVYFDFDRSEIRSDAAKALSADAESLKAIFRDFPNVNVVIEGHCDERGSAEYNLALGDRRASSAKQFLIQVGVPTERLVTISYGKERPQCTESNETCWQKNRRVHFAPGEEQKPKLVSQETEESTNR